MRTLGTNTGIMSVLFSGILKLPMDMLFFLRREFELKPTAPSTTLAVAAAADGGEEEGERRVGGG